ncbi:MAG TPA: hypothetical protein VGY77_01955 [Gemmataceae bacterium]|nr:hypothetical protein [Gemmataceae bacterium]
MSTSGLSHKSAFPNPTRQKLDELDQLIQKMLELPVNPLDPALLDSLERTKDEMDEQSAKENFQAPVEETLPDPDLEKVAWEGSSRPAIEPARVAVDLEDTAPVTGFPAESISDFIPESPVVSKFGSMELTPLETIPAQPVWENFPGSVEEPLGVLGWVNRIFDGGVMLLGPPGQWLRGPAGRPIVGWVGIGFLVAALVWGILDWWGW